MMPVSSASNWPGRLPIWRKAMWPGGCWVRHPGAWAGRPAAACVQPARRAPRRGDRAFARGVADRGASACACFGVRAHPLSTGARARRLPYRHGRGRGTPGQNRSRLLPRRDQGDHRCMSPDSRVTVARRAWRGSSSCRCYCRPGQAHDHHRRQRRGGLEGQTPGRGRRDGRDVCRCAGRRIHAQARRRWPAGQARPAEHGLEGSGRRRCRPGRGRCLDRSG